MIHRRPAFAALIAVLACAGGATLACPNPDIPAASQISTNGASLRLGDSVRATAGGTQSIAGCDYLALTDTPAALFNAAPSLAADLFGMPGLALEVKVTSRCPVAMLVRTAEGAWYFDDDGQGPGRPLLLLSRPPSGMLQVWLGTAGGDACTARVSLTTLRG